MEQTKYILSALTSKILASYFKVYNTLGYGFLEKVYSKAMIKELQKAGLSCEIQKPIDVYYDGAVVGSYFADIVVEGKVIIELKAAESLLEEHEAQLVNYLKATNIEVGLLLNFGVEPQIKRKAFNNQYKQSRSYKS